ncbi:MAG: hypothetical protein GF419_01470 [Ignavibacteriales bacterium]|nr:hypothetical protein [Ignavibacteriales bacterium]
MAKIKNIEAYCDFCDATTKMELANEAGEGFEDDRRWAKCKKCKQMTLVDVNEIGKDKAPTAKDVDGENCETYSPKKEFEVGESIYHQGFEDFGVVVSKERLSNGKSSILVEFQKEGTKKLLETPKES